MVLYIVMGINATVNPFIYKWSCSTEPQPLIRLVSIPYKNLGAYVHPSHIFVMATDSLEKNCCHLFNRSDLNLFFFFLHWSATVLIYSEVHLKTYANSCRLWLYIIS